MNFNVTFSFYSVTIMLMLLTVDQWNKNIKLVFSVENVFRLVNRFFKPESFGPPERALVVTLSVPVGAYRCLFCLCYVILTPLSLHRLCHFHRYALALWWLMDDYTFISPAILVKKIHIVACMILNFHHTVVKGSKNTIEYITLCDLWLRNLH